MRHHRPVHHRERDPAQGAADPTEHLLPGRCLQATVGKQRPRIRGNRHRPCLDREGQPHPSEPPCASGTERRAARRAAAGGRHPYDDLPHEQPVPRDPEKVRQRHGVRGGLSQRGQLRWPQGTEDRPPGGALRHDGGHHWGRKVPGTGGKAFGKTATGGYYHV